MITTTAPMMTKMLGISVSLRDASEAENDDHNDDDADDVKNIAHERLLVPLKNYADTTCLRPNSSKP